MNEILDQLRSTLESELTGRGITTFFKGKVEIPAQSDLPMLMVYPIATRQSHSGTVRDQAEYDIGVEIVVSLKQYFDMANGQGTQIDALDDLVDIVEERESDGDAKSNTLIYVINNNITVSDKVLYTNNIEVAYEPYYLAGEFPHAKVTVQFTAFDRPNRT